MIEKMTYDELFQKYKALLSETERLKAENAELKNRLGIAEPENAKSLENCGINVRYKSDFHQKFTIIDNQTVWYGSVNFLSFGTHDESIMRFQNTEIAGALIDTVL